MADRQTDDILADSETSSDELSAKTAQSDDVIEMLGFDPRELNMLGFELDDDGI